jgi:ADP-heptose:LPS heptosyltransferase
MGDVLMSLPALADLRAALPAAHLRLAVGSWSAELARSAPVDEVVVWSAPWARRSGEAGGSWRSLVGKALALRAARLDLALDLQGDVGASLLMALSAARCRVGYANTGGAYLLTRVVPLDETVSWVEQNRRAVAVALGRAPGEHTIDLLREEDRAFVGRFLSERGLGERRPLVGIHPAGGRAIKQWPIEAWATVATRLQLEHDATILVTGSTADRALAGHLLRALPRPVVDVTGRLSVRETLALISALDVFLSPDTGPMHMACAVGTPSVAVFGPSDPVRYFSGGPGRSGGRHVVVRAELWCSPCNLIRKPPRECRAAAGPECLRRVEPEAVLREAARLLRSRPS